MLLEQMLQRGTVTPNVCCNAAAINLDIGKINLNKCKILVVCLLTFYKLGPISLDMESNEADHLNKE